MTWRNGEMATSRQEKTVRPHYDTYLSTTRAHNRHAKATANAYTPKHRVVKRQTSNVERMA
jgi:hypothetical protein